MDRRVWWLLGLTGCLKHGPAEVRMGTAKPPAGPRVLMLAADCASAQGDCDADLTKAVQSQVAQELELWGYSIVNADTLMAQARSRQDQTAGLQLFGAEVARMDAKAQSGSIYEDLSPAARTELLASAHAEGAVATHVTLANQGQPSIQVQLRFGQGDGAALYWLSRCQHETWYAFQRRAEASAVTRCALDALHQKLGN